MTGGVITAVEGGILTGVEFGIAGFAVGVGSSIGSGERDAGNIFKAGGLGFAAGFATGFVVGATYAGGLQDFAHGFDSQKANELYKGAQQALGKGQLAEYAKYARGLIELGVNPPSGVLAGYSTIKGPIDHTYLVAIKKGKVTASGWNPEEFGLDVLRNKKVSGMVANEKYLLSTSRFSEALTLNIETVDLVLKNMGTVRLDYYQMKNMNLNCYGWRNAVLKASNIEPLNDSYYGWSH